MRIKHDGSLIREDVCFHTDLRQRRSTSYGPDLQGLSYGAFLSVDIKNIVSLFSFTTVLRTVG